MTASGLRHPIIAPRPPAPHSEAPRRRHPRLRRGPRRLALERPGRFPDLTFAEYRYDGLGRRIEKDADGTVTRYVYDGEDILVEFDGAGALLARYSHGQESDQPLAVARGGQEFFYHADRRGSLRKISDAAGLVRVRG